MSPEISERSFEAAIEHALLAGEPDASPRSGNVVTNPSSPLYGDDAHGGYRKRRPEDFDRALCLIPRDVVDFVLATPPREWKKLEQHHGVIVREVWSRSAEIRQEIRLVRDDLVGTLKHLHGIVWIVDSNSFKGATGWSPLAPHGELR